MLWVLKPQSIGHLTHTLLPHRQAPARQLDDAILNQIAERAVDLRPHQITKIVGRQLQCGSEVAHRKDARLTRATRREIVAQQLLETRNDIRVLENLKDRASKASVKLPTLEALAVVQQQLQRRDNEAAGVLVTRQ